MTDHYLEAVRTWQQVNRNLKHFAECCAYVNERKIRSLASDCGVSEKTVRNYRNAYLLYLELGQNKEKVSKLWQSGNISLWVKAAQLQSQLSLPIEKVMEYLELAVYYKMPRESFAAHVDEAENQVPKWIRRIRHAIKVLYPSTNDWKTEMPIAKRERYEQATARYIEELQEIAEGEEESV